MTVRDLLARCEAATGPDCELDLAIAMATRTGSFSRSATFEQIAIVMRQQDKDDGLYEDEETGQTGVRTRFVEVPAVTSNLDAAIALVERLLPGWSWEVRQSGFGNPAQANIWNPRRAASITKNYRADRHEVALALVCAALKALIDRGDGDAA